MKLKTQIDFEGYIAGKQANIHIVPLFVDSPNKDEEPFLWARFVDDETGEELLDVSIEELTEIIRALEIAAKAEQEAQASH